MNRRDFSALMGMGTVLATLPGCTTLLPKRTGKIIPPDQKLRIAMIGVGHRGRQNLTALMGEDVVAICEVCDIEMGKAAEISPSAKRYKDYRVMLKEMDDQIDAVAISTPDHMHYPPAITAIKMGKHVFVEKPLTHTPWEARQLLEASRKHQVVTQMGNHGHANEGTRLVREWMQAGLIGKVREAHVWTNKPVPSVSGKPSPWWPDMLERPTETPPVPDTLDWNLWLGVAPERPYHSVYHPKRWRRFWEFGTGGLGDMACHVADAAFYGLQLDHPLTVEAEGIDGSAECAPTKEKVVWTFGARGEQPPVTLSWYGGGWKVPHPKFLEETRSAGKKGVALIGENGAIMWFDDYCRSPRLVPESLMQEVARGQKLPPKTIPRVPKGNHWMEWVDACKGGLTPGSNFEHSVPLTEMVVLGNIALRTGKKIEWDAANCTVANVPEANELIYKKYRKF